MIRATLAIPLAVMLLTSCSWPGLGSDTYTLTVRNNLGRDATLEITESQLQVRKGARTIAAPIVVPPGEHQVQLMSLEMEWSLQLRGVEGFYESADFREMQRQVDAGEMRSFSLTVDAGGLSVESTAP